MSVPTTQPSASGGASSTDDPPLADGGVGSDQGGAPSNVGGSPEAGTGAAGVGAGAGGTDSMWSDVVPVRTRVGPQTAPHELFASELQLGAFWEMPNGNVLTSFRTSITHPEPGIAIDDYHYKLQTIVGNAIEPTPDVEWPTCRYNDFPYGACSVGPDPDGPTLHSLVTDAGAILVTEEKPPLGLATHTFLERFEPATGKLSTFADLSDVEHHHGAYNARLTLRQLADGTIALSTAMEPDPARTLVFDAAGKRLAERAGFAFGERWQRFALFLGETAGSYNQRFDWWDPRTGASAVSAFGFPPANPAPYFYTFVTPVGDVIFPGVIYTDRLMHIDASGSVVEDRDMARFSFLGSLPDGRYLSYEPDQARGYVLNLYDRSGASTAVYDEPTLMKDAGWPAFGSGPVAYYPVMDHTHFAAVVDDAGNSYVGFVLETDGPTTETYLVAFAADGHKLWGYKLKTTFNGVCQPAAALLKHRLVVRCGGVYVRRFLILGE